MPFPIDLGKYQSVSLDLSQAELSQEQENKLVRNVNLIRDCVVYFTALANTKGLGGHTGGAYDIIPELMIVDGLVKGDNDLYPVFFDEAGHRVAAQYIMTVLNGYLEEDALNHYREFGKGLYGHPELNEKMGIFFSSGRLGHLWSYVNGIAEANPEKKVILFGSDGSQQEGDDAEAARYAVARNLNINLIIDDNDVTIAGHPSEYLKGFDVGRTLDGHGLKTFHGDGENIRELYGRIRAALVEDGPAAIINKRKMAPFIPGIEGTTKGHDVIPVSAAIEYLKQRGYVEPVVLLESSPDKMDPKDRKGSSAESGKNRDLFGVFLCEMISGMGKPAEEILVVDSDLEGSCGLHHVRKEFPDVYVSGGIMERNNFSVAAGFGSEKGRQGVFGTFAAFQEMVISEITMARLNNANVISHFSHSGVDDMADNTCHFGINNLFADNGLPENDTTRLYFPADSYQLKAVMQRIFHDPGLRFIFSTRSAVPYILKEDGELYYGEEYEFKPGRDECIREAKKGYVISYGEMLYRSLDAVERLRESGIDVGLINKPTLNVVDEEAIRLYGAADFILVVEAQNVKTGLGSKMGTWLLERGLSPKYGVMGTNKEGCGGLSEQVAHQGLETEAIMTRIKSIM